MSSGLKQVVPSSPSDVFKEPHEDHSAIVVSNCRHDHICQSGRSSAADESIQTNFEAPRSGTIATVRAKKATGAATISFSAIRMVVQQTFDDTHGWLSEYLEKVFLGPLSQRTMEKSEYEHHCDLMAFLTKYHAQVPRFERFLGIMEATSRNCGQAVLFYAVQEGNLIAIERLLSEGLADVNAPDRDLRSPLLHSILFSANESTLELLQYGADVHFEDDKKHNALWYAVQMENYPAIEHLLEFNAIMVEIYDDDDSEMPVSTQPSEEAQKLHRFLQPHASRSEIPVAEGAVHGSVDDTNPVLDSTAPHEVKIKAESEMGATVPAGEYSDPAEENGQAQSDENYTDEDESGSTCSECCGSSDEGALSYEANSSNQPSLDADVLISRASKVVKEEILEHLMTDVSDLLGYSTFRSATQGSGAITSLPLGSGSAAQNSSQAHARKSSSSSGTRSASNRSTHSGRRSSNGAPNRDDGKEDDDNSGRRNAARLGLGDRDARKKRPFACPYFVRYPENYRDSRRTACRNGRGWVSTHRLKYCPIQPLPQSF
jgi:hypothetical protein